MGASRGRLWPALDVAMTSEPTPTAPSPRIRWQALWHVQGLRFVVIGIGNTLTGYLLFWGLYSLLVPALPYAVVAVLTHIGAVTVSFLCQRQLVYRSEGRWWLEYLRFHLAHLGLFLAGLGALALLVERVGWHPLLAQAVVYAGVAASGYFIHTFFTFRQNKPSPPPMARATENEAHDRP